MYTVMKLGRCMVREIVREGRVEGDSFVYSGQRVPLEQVQLVAPCVPSKIIGVGRNYADHAAELKNPLPKEPLLFFKPPSAVNDPGGDVVYPHQSQQVDFEGELAVVIAMRCKGVRARDAGDVILGYTLCNDFTARDLQRSDGQWARAKGFDGFASLGPVIATGLDPSKLRLRTYVNGTLKQDAPTKSMIFDIPFLIEYISAAFTLEPGDIITTGTPAGVDALQPGDIVEVAVDEIGVLRNQIVTGKEKHPR